MRQQLVVVAAVTVGVLACAGVGLRAQASRLAELAKQEEERRKGIATPAKVITIQDARKYLPPPAPPAPATPASGTATATAGDATQSATGQAADAQTKPAADAPPDPLDEFKNRDEAWWRDRATSGRASLERTRFYLTALISQVSALTAELTNPDQAIRAAAVTQLRATQDEIDKVRTDVDKMEKTVRDLEDAARQLGVSPDWLR